MENELFEEVKKEVTACGEAVGEVGKLRLIDLISRLLGLFLLIFTIVLLLSALFTFGAVAAIDILSNYMPTWAASLLIGSVYLVLIGVVLAFKKQLFIHPFIRLMSKQINTEEELALKTLEAEHKAEIQYIRLETKVESATRELNIYANLVSRIWSWVTGKLTK